MNSLKTKRYEGVSLGVSTPTLARRHDLDIAGAGEHDSNVGLMFTAAFSLSVCARAQDLGSFRQSAAALRTYAHLIG
jgi:hypothetical protein